jgi:hypothetical protein
VTITDSCLSATISPIAVSGKSYTIYATALPIPITAFTSTVPDSKCGTITYTGTNADNTAFDSSVFTFSQTPSFSVYSTNILKAGSYTLKVSG